MKYCLFGTVVENFGSYYMEMKKREVLAEKKKRLQVEMLSKYSQILSMLELSWLFSITKYI